MRAEEITELLSKYGFNLGTQYGSADLRPAFDAWYRDAAEFYRLLYKAKVDAHDFETRRVRLMDASGEFAETFEEHAARLDALDKAIRRDVLDHINHVLEPDDFKKCQAGCDPLAQEYWRNEVRHTWVGCQEMGGTVQIGYMVRIDALEYLKKAVAEVNVIYIDDTNHFIFFRTPSIVPSKLA
jgi:PHP family Zn ribbon phosphoesterase